MNGHTRWELVAVAEDARVSVEPWRAAAGDEGTLQLTRLYGLRLSLRDPGGGPPEIAPELWVCGGTGWSVEAESDCGQVREPFLHELLGLPHADIHGERPSKRFIYGSGHELERFGPISFSRGLPGYRPEQWELWLPPWEGGPLAERTIVLERDPRPSRERRRCSSRASPTAGPTRCSW